MEAWEFLRQGGWIMVPLGACSVVALAIVLERAFALRRNRVLNPYILDAIEAYQGEASVEGLLNTCRRSGGALAAIVEEVLHARRLEREHALELMRSVGRREVAGLERGLTMLEIIAGASPLLGLLGTVLGMVTVFDAITAAGIGDPQVLSAGISKALVTTVAGLCIAIPALAFHSYFSKRVESFAVEMEDIATGFAVRVHTLGRVQRRAEREIPAPAAQPTPGPRIG